MSYGSTLVIKNISHTDLTINVRDVDGMDEDLNFLENVVVKAGKTHGAYIETHGLFESKFTLIFTGSNGTSGSVHFTEDRYIYRSYDNTSPELIDVSIQNDSDMAKIEIILNPVGDRSNWMSELEGLGELPISTICLPGTHDSGAYEINTWYADIKPGLTITQDLRVADQLKAGARYFDIRPGNLLGNNLELFHQHGSINCGKLVDIYTDIAEFASTHPKELIFITLSHIEILGVEDQDPPNGSILIAATSILTYLQDYMVPNTLGSQATLDDVRATGKNIIVFMNPPNIGFDSNNNSKGVDLGDLNNLFWDLEDGLEKTYDNDFIIEDWGSYADSVEIDKLETFIKNTIDTQKNKTRTENFFLLQCQLTPGFLDAPISILSTRSKPHVRNLIDVEALPENATTTAFAKVSNFFIVDYYDPSWTEISIAVNQWKLKNRTK